MRTKIQLLDLTDKTGAPAGQHISTKGDGTFILEAPAVGSASGTIVVYDENTLLGSADVLRFVGAAVSVKLSGTFAHIEILGGGGAGGLGIYAIDDGVPIGTGSWIDFGNELDVSISGTVLRVDRTAPGTGSVVLYDEQTILGSVAELVVEGDPAYASRTGSFGYVSFSGSFGPQGPEGATGSAGLTGPPGAEGATGSAGPQGPEGATGSVGPQGAEGATGSTGPQGAEGATGTTGAQGPEGATGSVGPQGAEGATGSTGPQGIEGATGSVGPQGPAGDTDPKVTIFTVDGDVVVVAGQLRMYNRWEREISISKVFIAVGEAPLDDSLIADIHQDGTTIFTTQANRPTIASGTFTNTSPAPDIQAWVTGSYLTMDVDQIGSAVAGSDLVVHVIGD